MPDARIGAVAIGRNEGARLVRCLTSLMPVASRVVYVDFGLYRRQHCGGAGLGRRGGRARPLGALHRGAGAQRGSCATGRRRDAAARPVRRRRLRAATGLDRRCDSLSRRAFRCRRDLRPPARAAPRDVALEPARRLGMGHARGRGACLRRRCADADARRSRASAASTQPSSPARSPSSVYASGRRAGGSGVSTSR